jgi:hypothetical protein
LRPEEGIFRMLTLYLLQAIVPLAIIGWLAFAPPRSAIGFWTQALSIGIALVAISLTGIWTFPPWWAPYVFGALLLTAVLAGLVKNNERSLLPQGSMGWLSLAGFVALGLYAANETQIALADREIPEGHAIELSSPLAAGTYLIANGGAGLSVNAHAELLDQSLARHRPYWGTAHGVDIVALDRWGLRADGIMPADPARYVIFARPVIAPCAGHVTVAVDGLADMQVPQVDSAHLAGNHVILRCSGTDILLGHFRKGSVLVRVGQSLAIGDAIAQVGNSGNTSEPHLHINAQQPGSAGAPFDGAPIPIRINGRYLFRNDRFEVQTRGRLPS